MLPFLLIPALILLSTLQSLFCKCYSDRYPGQAENASPVFSTLEGFAVAAMTCCLSGFSLQAGPLTWLLGLLNGLILTVYNTALIRASAAGPYSLVMICMLFGGILIPLAESTLLFQTVLSSGQLCAIAMMLVSFIFLNWKGLRSHTERPPLVFYLLCGALFLTNGLYCSILDIPQKLGNGEKDALIVLTYLFCGLFSLLSLLYRQRGKTLAAMKQSRASAFFMVCCFLIVTFSVNLQVYCLSLVDVAILSPLNNGGVLLLSVLYSCILFHERIDPAKWVGILLSLGSIVLLSVL